MNLLFNPSDSLSLGVELELQLIDSNNFDLTPRSMELFKILGNNPYIVPEVMQSMVEVKTSICSSAQEAENELRDHLKLIQKISEKIGISFACSGTHPSAKHWERKIFPLPRYSDLIDRNQFISRRLIIFGLHVHIGVRSGDECIDLMNEFLYEMPILLALSASSPFWEGIDTGLASSRVTIFEATPTGGHPCKLTNWEDYQKLVSALITAKSIKSYKDIWWDLRPSPTFGTLEIRICDGMPTLKENMANVALIHCLADFYLDDIRKGKKRMILPDWIVRENKWRASRHGVEADLIISEGGEHSSLIDIANKLLNKLDPYFRKYGYEDYKHIILNSLKGFTSYQRQRDIFESTKELSSVTKLLIAEMKASI